MYGLKILDEFSDLKITECLMALGYIKLYLILVIPIYYTILLAAHGEPIPLTVIPVCGFEACTICPPPA